MTCLAYISLSTVMASLSTVVPAEAGISRRFSSAVTHDVHSLIAIRLNRLGVLCYRGNSPFPFLQPLLPLTLSRDPRLRGEDNLDVGGWIFDFGNQREQWQEVFASGMESIKSVKSSLYASSRFGLLSSDICFRSSVICYIVICYLASVIRMSVLRYNKSYLHIFLLG
jgi:hypothetical protein